MQGAVDALMSPVGEKTEAGIGGVNGIKSWFLFFEHIVVSISFQQVWAVHGSLGQDLDDPLHLLRGNTDLKRRAAAFLSTGAAVAAVLKRQQRLDVNVYAVAFTLRHSLLKIYFRFVRFHTLQNVIFKDLILPLLQDPRFFQAPGPVVSNGHLIQI
jgi:hypothetical protein